MNKSLWFGGGTEGVTGQVKLVLNTHTKETNTNTHKQKHTCMQADKTCNRKALS